MDTDPVTSLMSSTPLPIPLPINWFTLPPINSSDNYLAARDLILYWLCRPGFSTARSDTALITDPSNALASQFWEGQIRTALKDGPTRFLFENNGSTYFDKGFQMLQVLEDHFRPSSISNTFTTLLSLFNDRQGDTEGIHQFCSRFEGHLLALSCSLVAIPSILQVMLFLWAIHSHYQDLLNQFVTKQKDLSSATFDSVVADAKFMDEFATVGLIGKAICPSYTPHSPAAATAVTNRSGREHCFPWEWLSTLESSGILSCWHWSLKGGFYCCFCHTNDKHNPLKCPMLAKLNLKLIDVGGGSLGGVGVGSKSLVCGPLASPSPGTPGAKVAAAVSHTTPSNEAPPSALVGMAAALVVVEDEDLTDSFCWDEDNDGATFADARNSKALVSSYAPPSPGPACCNVCVKLALPYSTYLPTHQCDNIVLPSSLIHALQKAIPTTTRGTPFCLVVANTGATTT
jgi:hypothetical protein